MPYPALIAVAVLAALLLVCSMRDVTADARTPAQMLIAARRHGVLRSAAAGVLAVLVVVLLIATAFPLSLATLLANLGGMR